MVVYNVRNAQYCMYIADLVYQYSNKNPEYFKSLPDINVGFFNIRHFRYISWIK